MSGNERTIRGESHKSKIEVEVDGEIICTVSYNPKSELFVRNMARLVQALNEVAKLDGFAMPSFPEDDDDDPGASLDALDSAGKALGQLADTFDEFIAAADKIIGVGVAESIIAEDDDNMTLFMSVLEPIFADYKKAREEKTNKYRTKPKPLPAPTPASASAPIQAALPDPSLAVLPMPEAPSEAPMHGV